MRTTLGPECVTLPARSGVSIASEIEDVFSTAACSVAAFYVPLGSAVDDGYSDARAFDVRFSDHCD